MHTTPHIHYAHNTIYTQHHISNMYIAPSIPNTTYSQHFLYHHVHNIVYTTSHAHNLTDATHTTYTTYAQQ